MKFAVALLALIALTSSAPQTRKVFHEHVEDFLDIIGEEAGHHLEHLLEHYLEFEEFWVSLNYIRTADFKNLILEMESLPEFKAVIDFLEKDNIDIQYFIERFNSLLVEDLKAKKSRHSLSGTDFTAFINDCISEFPKNKLSALFDQKLNESEEFKSAIDNLYSEEWDAIYHALWESAAFQAEIQILAEHGIEFRALLNEVIAIFGQN